MAATNIPLHHLDSPAQAVQWLRDRHVEALTVDSRAVAPLVARGRRVAFVAWPGAARDGRAFVPAALADGAVACLVEAEGAEALGLAGAGVATLTGLKRGLAEVAHRFHAEPSHALDVVAVTGTNGKTSTSWWTAQVLGALGRPCGVIGTLGTGRPDGSDFTSTGLTTPDPVTLHGTFRHFVDLGLKAAAIEASSIGIEERRLDATRITVAQFTNFTQDHLDYHGSMQAYWEAKRALFDWPGLQAAVINLDDPRGPELLAHAQGRGLTCWTTGLHVPARLRAVDVQVSGSGQRFTVVESDEAGVREHQRCTVDVPLLGEFNVANVLTVLGAARALGHDLPDAVAACAALTAVPGRMQQVRAGQADVPGPLAVVDYAHTPDALLKALQALRPVAQARGGRLWCVFGCGGNRDPLKRPLMGEVADVHADELVLTSDNPRREPPADILAQVRAGVARVDRLSVVEDRRQAIVHALTQARESDVVLVAGKGHEATQDIEGIQYPFSDVEECRKALDARRPA